MLLTLLLSEEVDSIQHQAFDTVSLTKESVFAAIKRVEKIHDLDLSAFTTLANLEPLSRLTDLKSLNLTGTQVTDLLPIRNLNFLETLNISKCKIQTLAPLRLCKTSKIWIFQILM